MGMDGSICDLRLQCLAQDARIALMGIGKKMSLEFQVSSVEASELASTRVELIFETYSSQAERT